MPSKRTSSTVEVLFTLDRSTEQTLHGQLEQQIRESVREGRFPAAMTMPSTRALAAQLDVTRGVVVEAYEQLAAEGYLVSTPGGSTRVADGIAEPARSIPQDEPSAYRFDFRPGRPDLTEFPRAAWTRSYRRALGAVPAERLGYLEGHGTLELRRALSTYLDRVRGTATDPTDMVITSGFVQVLQLLARVGLRSGARRVAVEDPWHADYRRVLRAAGVEVVPVPVDHEGMDVGALEAADADIAILTPAHQYPTGAVLSGARRAALLAWAAKRDALVVEDDYDAEFRYDREPIGALQGLAPDRVVYAGTASKTLAPGLRLGWLAVPRRLSDRFARAKLAADYGSGALEQLALADFVERGELDRHLRRMRQTYRRRRDALLDTLASGTPGVRVLGASAGLHVMARLPATIDEASVVREAAQIGIGLSGAGETYAGSSPGPGLVFGYATMSEHLIVAGIAALAPLIKAPHEGDT